jgi:hypothetical protein
MSTGVVVSLIIVIEAMPLILLLPTSRRDVVWVIVQSLVELPVGTVIIANVDKSISSLESQLNTANTLKVLRSECWRIVVRIVESLKEPLRIDVVWIYARLKYVLNKSNRLWVAAFFCTLSCKKNTGSCILLDISAATRLCHGGVRKEIKSGTILINGALIIAVCHELGTAEGRFVSFLYALLKSDHVVGCDCGNPASATISIRPAFNGHITGKKSEHCYHGNDSRDNG